MIRHLFCVLPLVVCLVGCATTNSGTANSQVTPLAGVGRYRIRIDDAATTPDSQMNKALELKASKVASSNGFRNADILTKKITKGTANTSQGSYPVKVIDATIQCHYLKLGDTVAAGGKSNQGPGEKKAPKKDSSGGGSGGSNTASNQSSSKRSSGDAPKNTANETRQAQRNTIRSGGASQGAQSSARP